LRRREVKPEMINGKVRYVAPIDWGETNKLWREDEDAKENKQLVKVKPGYVYFIKYLRSLVNKTKMKYYTFSTVRNIKRNKMKEVIESNHINALDFYDPKEERRNG
jgi:hypothetical protein